LLAKKYCAARGWMADAVCGHIKVFQLSGSDQKSPDLIRVPANEAVTDTVKFVLLRLVEKQTEIEVIS
jgi:hypothetical protein